MKRWVLLWMLLPSPVWGAERVVCHYHYGGEDQVIEATPTAAPYQVQPLAIGSYFLFKVVFVADPASLAAVKLYTYWDSPNGPLPIHQASYPHPAATALTGPHGFTGLNFVYEPFMDGELKYWCRMNEERDPT